MLLDAKHKPWIWTVVALTAATTAVYIPYHLLSTNGPSGSSWIGLSFGIAAFALMLFAGLLGFRRRFPAWRVGRPETWLRAHLWLGLLAVPWTFFHGGFRFGGTLTIILMFLLILVTLSGILGVILQQILPRVMTSRVTMETVYEQIARVMDQLLAEADTLVLPSIGPIVDAVVSGPTPVEGAGALREFYQKQIRPFLAGAAPKGALSSAARAAVAFTSVRPLIPPKLQDILRDLEVVCEERRQLISQKKLHRWLHGWLLVHIPLSYALLLLGAAHAVGSVRF
ncbi:MAG TPA: hypothetical protein VF950_25105 [Planctomycetota bacterium]